jgi:hypothetical protein
MRPPKAPIIAPPFDRPQGYRKAEAAPVIRIRRGFDSNEAVSSGYFVLARWRQGKRDWRRSKIPGNRETPALYSAKLAETPRGWCSALSHQSAQD